MSKLSGSVLILAGIAVAAYAVYPQPRDGTEIAATQSVDIAAEVTTAPATRGATFPATLPDPAAASIPTPAKSEPPAASVVPSVHLVPPSPMSGHRLLSGVTVVRVDQAPPRVPVGETKSAAVPILDRAALSREIQRQLKRIGCYRGDLTDVWSSSVRQAMQTLIERANASLPVNEPDLALLAIVQSHEPGVCSASCPSGQDRAANGRCVPSFLVASVGTSARAGTGTSAGVGSSAKTRVSANARSNGAASMSTGALKQASRNGGQVLASPQTAPYRPMDRRMSLAGPPASQQAKAPPGSGLKAAPRRHASTKPSPPFAQARSQERQAQPQQSYSYPGLPTWAIPVSAQ